MVIISRARRGKGGRSVGGTAEAGEEVMTDAVARMRVGMGMGAGGREGRSGGVLGRVKRRLDGLLGVGVRANEAEFGLGRVAWVFKVVVLDFVLFLEDVSQCHGGGGNVATTVYSSKGMNI